MNASALRIRLRYRLARFARRAGIGLRYAFGRSTQDDASILLYEMQHVAGLYTLSTFDIERVLERAREDYQDHPELERLCEDAAARVAHKWSSTGDESSAAIDWAFDLVGEYALNDGIILCPREGAVEQESAS